MLVSLGMSRLVSRTAQCVSMPDPGFVFMLELFYTVVGTFVKLTLYRHAFLSLLMSGKCTIHPKRIARASPSSRRSLPAKGY